MTSTAQGGDLQHTVQADLGEGLVIAPGVSALEAMPKEPDDTPLVASDVEFDLRDGTEKEGGLRVSTAYRGSEADAMRRSLRRKSPADLGDSYLNYYKRRYDSVRAVEPPKVTDDLRANQLTIDESYRVEHFFEADDAGKRLFYLEAETINEHLGALDTRVRSTPLDLEAPVNLSQHIRIRMPEKFPGTDDVVKIETAQFQYMSRVSHSGNDVLLDYHYRVMADDVPPEGLAEFVKKRASAKDETYYRFTEAQEGPSRDAVNGAEKQLQEAGRLIQGTQLEKADEVLKSLLASDGFRGLSAPRRHIAVYLAGVVALEKDDAPRTLELLRRAARFDEADFDDWNMRLLAAERARDHAEATLTLTTLAEHWPENLGEVDARVIRRVVHDTPHTGASRYQLLSALSKANYKSEEGYEGYVLSHWWRDLALLQLEHADQAAAQKTLEKLTDPAALISVRADNRFAPIRDGLSLDIPAAIATQVQQAREAVKAHPTKLHPVVVLMWVLRQSLDFAEAVQLGDAAVSAMSGPKGPKVYDDYKESRVWVLDARGEALYRLGKWDEAVAQLTAARQLPEMGDVNVSQTINLAGLYNDLGKPREALTTLAELASDNVSPYGLMQAATERVASADQLGDAAEVEKQLALLKEHQQDSVSTYQRALISANHLDEAAQLLISRLQDPDQRIDALLDVQDYKEAVLGPRAVEWQKRWAAVRHRRDVVEAIGKVGTVSAYPMLPQSY